MKTCRNLMHFAIAPECELTDNNRVSSGRGTVGRPLGWGTQPPP